MKNKGSVMSHEALSPQEENSALYWRNQQRGVVDNIRVRGFRLTAAENSGTLGVVIHDKALKGYAEDLEYFTAEAGKHADAHLGAYIETARREAEADGHKIDPQRPNSN